MMFDVDHQLLMIMEDSRLRHHGMMREWNDHLSHGTMGFSPTLLTFENSLKETTKAGMGNYPSFFCEGDKFYMLLQRQLVSLFLHSWTYYTLMKRGCDPLLLTQLALIIFLLLNIIFIFCHNIFGYFDIAHNSF